MFAGLLFAMRSSRLRLQVNALRQIVKQEGTQALWHGVSARVAFHIPSAAVCWGVYESLKTLMQVT